MSRRDQPHKLTFAAFVAKCSDPADPRNEKHANLDYAKPETQAAWNGSKSKIPIWCRDHGEFFIQQAANHMNGQGCPKCGTSTTSNKRRKDDPITALQAVHGDRYDYSRASYVNSHTKIEIVCQKHGPFLQRPNAHLRGNGCPKCLLDRRKVNGAARTQEFTSTFAARAAEVHKGAYAIVQMPTRVHDIAVLHCPKHGEFSQKAYSHLAGIGCPSCGSTTSYAQLEVSAFIEGLGVNVERENRTILDGLHIDIWAHELNIGVEYNGSYWHTEARIGNRHREKYELATAKGVRLIHLFDFEWLERRTAVENRLRAIFGVGKSVAARKCDLRAVPTKDASSFFAEWHTQGAGMAPTVAYGLFSDDTLVACASFGTSRFDGGGWEVLRYASIERVQGGFSRLLSAFVRNHRPDRVVSYSDLRWGNGGLYKAAGFSLEHVTAPDYWYTSGQDRISRFKAQGRAKGVTEKEWAEINGLSKVLGVGHQKWVLTPSPNPPAL